MGYGLIGLLRGNPFFTISCYSIFALIEVGLQEIAAAMSDPFGDDEIDFDTQVPLRRRYSAKASHTRVLLRRRYSAIASHTRVPLRFRYIEPDSRFAGAARRGVQ